MVFVNHRKSAKIVLGGADFVFKPEVALELDGEEGPVVHECGNIGEILEVVCEPALGIAFKEGTCKHDFGNVSSIEIGSSSKTNLVLANPAPKAFAISSIESAGVLRLWISCWIGGGGGGGLIQGIGNGVADSLAYERHCPLGNGIKWFRSIIVSWRNGGSWVLVGGDIGGTSGGMAIVRVIVSVGILTVVVRLGSVLGSGDDGSSVVSIGIWICMSADHDSLSVED